MRARPLSNSLITKKNNYINNIWQLVPVWDYSDTERMLVTTSLTPLLVNLQSMTSKPNAGGGSEYRVTWKVEEAVHNFVHADKVTRNSSTDQGK